MAMITSQNSNADQATSDRSTEVTSDSALWNRIKISTKLPLIITGASLLLSVAIGTANYLSASTAANTAIESKLTAIIEDRKVSLDGYLSSIEQDIRVTATNSMVHNAIRDFNSAWRELGTDQTETLQRLYIEDNPHPTGQKENLDAASDSSRYTATHRRYHPWFRRLLRERGYYDIFLFDLKGNLLYTVFKELDYATNLLDGEWKDTDLGNAYRAAADNPKAGTINFFDFKPYAPSHGAPASFMSTPIVNEYGVMQGVLVFQMPIDRINGIMSGAAGLGEKGEVYIVGSDHLMRNDSRFSEESTILAQEVTNPAIDAAITGEAVVAETRGYRGIDMLTATTPYYFNSANWVLVAEVAVDEAFAPVATMRNTMIMVATLMLVIVACLGTLLARQISNPLGQLTDAIRKLADGDTTITLSAAGRQDEIGDISKAVEVFRRNAVEQKRLESEKETENTAKLARTRRVESLVHAFEERVNGLLGSVAGSAGKLEITAQSMSATAEETSEQATSVARASDAASTNVQTVASAAEELTSSIQEIGHQVAQSSRIAEGAKDQAEATNQQVSRLVDAAQRIGDVVNLISDIAAQTNLLALNATIEAARAGVAGKGFAVVASEVKSLATQTAKATDEISLQIGGIQEATTSSADAITTISNIIQELNEISTAVAAAVEEQGSATREISKSVQQAALGTQEVSASIVNVTQAAGDTGNSASDVLNAATAMSQHAATMSEEVNRFLKDVRTA